MVYWIYLLTAASMKGMSLINGLSIPDFLLSQKKKDDFKLILVNGMYFKLLLIFLFVDWLLF